MAGTRVDSSIADDGFGNARLLIDAEKRCDLALSVAEPAEITFTGNAPAALTATSQQRVKALRRWHAGRHGAVPARRRLHR